MTDKLAEEIIKQFVVEVEGLDGIEYVSHELAIYCMQAYHEAKMRKEKIVESFERENQYLTDADFEEWASVQDFGYGANYYLMKAGAKMGFKAMRDGKIKPVSRDNDC